MIEELEIAYTSFCASYTVIMDLVQRKVEEENLCSGMVEAVARTCSVEKVFLETLQNSQENTCARVSF